ncbi:MAG: hypothetical protein ACXVI2_13200, partial [Ilumatobacteraceae bacterium]
MNTDLPEAITTGSRGGQLGEVELGSFPGATVVQLVSGDALGPDAVVSDVHRANVTVTDRRIAATDGEIAWAWLITDLQTVIHGSGAAWTIFVVPGVSDFGVRVPADRVGEFRRVLSMLPGVEV